MRRRGGGKGEKRMEDGVRVGRRRGKWLTCLVNEDKERTGKWLIGDRAGGDGNE